MSMTLEVSDHIQRALRAPKPERQALLLIEFACALYSTSGKSSASARQRHSRLSQFRFGHPGLLRT